MLKGLNKKSNVNRMYNTKVLRINIYVDILSLPPSHLLDRKQ